MPPTLSFQIDKKNIEKNDWAGQAYVVWQDETWVFRSTLPLFTLYQWTYITNIKTAHNRYQYRKTTMISQQ